MLGGQWSWQKPGEDFCSNCFAPTGDAKCPWNILPKMFLYVWWWSFFLFPQVSEMSNTLGIISHRILQQRWGNVLAFQTYLQCQGSSEELYMGSRMHHKKIETKKTEIL